MTAIRLPLDESLRRELEHPHEVAIAALDDPGTNPLVAVTWTATHVAAVARVLHPVARRVLPRGPQRMRSVVAADQALQQALWWLDRRLTGDARVATHEIAALQEAVRSALERHARREQALVAELVQHLAVAEQQALAARLARAVRRGPTRPHPNSPHHGLAAVLAFGLDAGADHLRDLLDSRSWPTPHDHLPARVSGRWGAYLTAAPYPREPKR
ncbi:MAG: hypothetical protein JWN55_1272 [Frankiales bacterium]|nr:hypothetical protein [Frankiales bacterium]